MMPGPMTVDMHPNVTTYTLSRRGRNPHWQLNFCSAMITSYEAP